jgi:hypothetical protein
VTGLEIYVLLPLIFIAYALIVYLHYLNIGIGEGELYKKSLLTLLITFILFLGIFLTGDSHELVSAIPVVGYYFSVGVVSQENIAYDKGKGIYFYIIILVFLFLLAVFLNI